MTKRKPRRKGDARMVNYYDTVVKAQQQLVAEGYPEIVPNEQAEVEKARLTRRAAYLINREKDPNVGLLKKTSGNNVDGLSVDWVLHKIDGSGADIATDVDAGPGKRRIKPIWIDEAGGGPPGDSWVYPTAAMAGLPDGPPPDPPDPPDPPEPPTIPPELSAFMVAVLASLARIETLLQAILDKPTGGSSGLLTLKGTASGRVPTFGGQTTLNVDVTEVPNG